MEEEIQNYLANDQQYLDRIASALSQVKEFCQRAIYLKNGEVAYDGQPQEAISLFIKE